MRLTDVLDALGVCCLAVFAFFCWWPAAFLVIGAALLLASFLRTRGGRK